MPQIPSQIVVSLVQLTVTTLQLFLMVFTWLNPRRARPFIAQHRAEAAMAAQQALEIVPVDPQSSAEQLTHSMLQPGVIHHPALPDSVPGIRGNRVQQQSSPTENDQHVEPRVTHQSMISI
ncbi:hypothetical protein F5Y03DRAFT_351324 [Xylaria venustula]|nr:hypothetical protein F5Y03DRAFT_351324 [Xylaria venustula]